MLTEDFFLCMSQTLEIINERTFMKHFDQLGELYMEAHVHFGKKCNVGRLFTQTSIQNFAESHSPF